MLVEMVIAGITRPRKLLPVCGRPACEIMVASLLAASGRAFSTCDAMPLQACHMPSADSRDTKTLNFGGPPPPPGEGTIAYMYLEGITAKVRGPNARMLP